VIAGLGVAGFRQPRQRVDADVLGDDVVRHAPGDFIFEEGVLVAQKVARLLGGELRAHPCQHDGRADRLDDVIGGADIEPVLFGLHVAERGDENHRNVLRAGVRAQSFHDFVAVHLRHHHVEQDQVGDRFGDGQPQRGGARVGDADVVMRRQQLTEHRQVFWSVVHH